MGLYSQEMADDQRRVDRPPSVRRAGARWAIAVAACGLAAIGTVGCTETTGVEPPPVDYLEELQSICADTAAQLDALPDPPDGITVTEFATQAGSILTAEAERFRGLDAPDDLDDDHRALIANDESQADGWTELAGAAVEEADAMSEITTTIASLNLGRNDLVTEMGAPGCVRAPG